MSRIYVIHENDAWVEPLRAEFSELAVAAFLGEELRNVGRMDLGRAAE